MTQPKYAAFISYASSEREVVAKLQRALTRFAKPLFRLHAVKIFFDKESLGTEPSLWGKLNSVLDQSKFLILVASKEAAKSTGVEREVTHWLETKGTDSIIFVLLSGDIKWGDAGATNALPRRLSEEIKEEPAYVDLKWAKSSPERLSVKDEHFRDAIASVSAQLQGRDKDELIGDARRQHKRVLRAIYAALLLLICAAAAAFMFAVRAERERSAAEAERARAEHSGNVATAARLAAQSKSIRVQLPAALPLSVLLALESLRNNPTPEGFDALREAVSLLPKRVALHDLDDTAGLVAFSPGGRYYLAASNTSLPFAVIKGGDETARVWAADSNQLRESFQHGGAVMAAAFSPDERMLATASFDHTVSVWDLTEARELASVVHRRPPIAVAFSPDSSFVVSLGRDGELYVWNPASGAVRFALDVRRPARESDQYATRLSQVMAQGRPELVISPNGELIAVALPKTGTCIVSAKSGRILHRIRHMVAGRDELLANGSYALLAVSGDSRLLAVSNYDSQVFVVDLQSGRITHRLKHHSFPTAVKFVRGGPLLLTGERDGAVHLWDVSSGQEVFTVQTHEVVNDLAVSPDGTLAAVACGDQTVRVWSIPDRQEVGRINSDAPATSVVISPDGGQVAVTGGKSVSVWEPRGFGLVRQFRHPLPLDLIRFDPAHEGLLVTLTRAPAGDYLLRRDLFNRTPRPRGPDAEQVAYIWDLQRGAQIKTIAHGEAITAVVLGADGGKVVTAGSDRVVRVTAADGTEILRLPHEDAVTKMALAPGGKILATTSGLISLEDSFNDTGKRAYLRLWDIDQGVEVRKLELHDPLQSLTFSPDGRFLVTIDRTEGILRRADDLTEILRLPGEGTLKSVVFSRAGDVMATASSKTTGSDGESAERVIEFWRKWDGPKPERILRVSLAAPVSALAFDPAGESVLVAAGNDVQVWSLARGTCTATLRHEAPVLSAVFNANGRYVATGSSDRSARVWDAVSGRELARILHPAEVISVQFRAAGDELLTAEVSGVVRVWRWRPEELAEEACARLTRNLSADEFKLYLPDEAYHKTCPNLP